jgi:hypothetical protein
MFHRGGHNKQVAAARAKQRNLHHYAIEVPMECRLYLKVPFEAKDEVKKLGARFDPDKKKWYADTRKPLGWIKRAWCEDVKAAFKVIVEATAAQRRINKI